MATLFRYDSWTKSANGVAIAGAQIYVLNQPANLSSPPTPQLQVYGDVGGLVPLTQPLITDGFGHVDFYVVGSSPFTVAVYFSGVLQNSYADQYPMSPNAGGGGTSAVPEFVQQITDGGYLPINFGINGALNTLIEFSGNSFGVLPDATTCPGQIVRGIKIDTSSYSYFVPVGTQTINSYNTPGYLAYYEFSNQWQSVILESDGSNWVIVGEAG